MTMVSLMSKERRDHQLTIRIPQRIRDAIGAQADKEQRSVADVVNNVLTAQYPAPAPKERRRR